MNRRGAHVVIPKAWAKHRLAFREAPCGVEDPDLFFDPTRAGEDAAKAVCAGCPVLERCRDLVDLLEADVPYAWWSGVWAGETRAERRQRRTATRPDPGCTPPFEGPDLGEAGLVDTGLRRAVGMYGHRAEAVRG